MRNFDLKLTNNYVFGAFNNIENLNYKTEHDYIFDVCGFITLKEASFQKLIRHLKKLKKDDIYNLQLCIDKSVKIKTKNYRNFTTDIENIIYDLKNGCNHALEQIIHILNLYNYFTNRRN